MSDVRSPGSSGNGTGASGVALIAAERERQVTAEGWTLEHDERHKAGQLADAAACLAATEPIFVRREQSEQNRRYSVGTTFVTPWPHETHTGRGESFSGPWRRPETDRIRDLVKAGALIAAEIDRLQRLDPSATGPSDQAELDPKGP